MPVLPLHRSNRASGIWLLLLAGLASLAMRPAEVAAGQSAGSPQYYLTITQPREPVCLGQPATLTVTWDTDPLADPLASLTPGAGGRAVPATGPRVLYASSPRKGELDHYTMHPAAPAGSESFTYTPQSEGPELIIFKAMDQELEVVGQQEVEFEVKKCSFNFVLYGQLRATIAGGGVNIPARYVIHAEGVLKPVPGREGSFAAEEVEILLETITDNPQLPGCDVVSIANGLTTGTVSVTAEQTEDGLYVRLSPPEGLSTELSWTVVCDGKTMTTSPEFPFHSGNNPWIRALFSAGTFAQGVMIDMFDEGVYNFQQNGISASYEASMILTGVDSQ